MVGNIFLQIDTIIEEVISQFSTEHNFDRVTQNTNIVWREPDGTSIRQFEFDNSQTGIKPEFYNMYNQTPYDFYKLFVTDNIMEHMVFQTNLYAEQVMNVRKKLKGHVKEWVPTTKAELEQFLGLLLWMGLAKFPRLKSYWTTNILYANKIKEIMPRDRFEKLLQMWHFSDNQDNSLSNDKLRKITALTNKLLDRYKYVLIPGSDICIDETLVPFRGRLKFRQYIKNKKNKFGIKLYKLCTSGGYLYNLDIYCGNDCGKLGNASANVVMNLMKDLLDAGRTLYTDNYYTSVSLAAQLLERKTHLVGTIRTNRKLNARDVVEKKLKRYEVFGQESNTGILLLKWRDTRDVLLLTTRHKNEVVTVRQRGKNIQKPKAIVDYNKSKAYIDISDQMKSYAHCLRRGRKWYRKLAVEILLGSTIVNAHLAYQEVTQKKLQITEFREQLSLALLGDKIPLFENNPPREEHKLEEHTKTRCVVCYATVKKNLGRVQAQSKTPRSKWQCSFCKKSYCVPCFFKVHHALKSINC